MLSSPILLFVPVPPPFRLGAAAEGAAEVAEGGDRRGGVARTGELLGDCVDPQCLGAAIRALDLDRVADAAIEERELGGELAVCLGDVDRAPQTGGKWAAIIPEVTARPLPAGLRS